MKIYDERPSRELFDEISQMMVDHAIEVGESDVPIFDINLMKQMNEVGVFKVLVARDDDGDAAGYLFFFISPDFFFQKVRLASEIGLYVKPSYRDLKTARLLVKSAEDYARESGADKITLHTSSHNDVGKLYERFGYKLNEKKYIKDVR